MTWQDSDTTGGKVRLKHSAVSGESLGAGGLVPGEISINVADGVFYFRKPNGQVGKTPDLFASAATYSAMVAIGVPSQATICKVDSDENKGQANTLYLLLPDGSRFWFAALAD